MVVSVQLSRWTVNIYRLSHSDSKVTDNNWHMTAALYKYPHHLSVLSPQGLGVCNEDRNHAHGKNVGT